MKAKTTAPAKPSGPGWVAPVAAVVMMGAGGVIAADWFGVVDLGIRRAFQPTPEALVVIAEESPFTPEPVASGAASAPGHTSGPADLRPEVPTIVSRPDAFPVLVSNPAQPTRDFAALKRGLDTLTRQRPPLEQEVIRYAAKAKASETPGPDRLTYEQRLLRDLKAAKRSADRKAIIRLETELETYYAARTENARRLEHAQEVLASLDQRITETRGEIAAP